MTQSDWYANPPYAPRAREAEPEPPVQAAPTGPANYFHSTRSRATMPPSQHRPFSAGAPQPPRPQPKPQPQSWPQAPSPHIGPAETPPPRGVGLTGVIGAVLSLMLIVGLGVWGYRLAVRDVTGIPVVRAMEGPMRIQPDDPGGDAAAHQGYAVNAVQAEGGAEAPAEQLALAPRAADLDVTDQPAAAPDVMLAAAPADEDDDLTVLAVAEAPDAAVGPETELTEVTDTVATLPVDAAAVDAAVAAAATTADAIPASVPGLSRSPRPVLRPGDFADTIAAARAAPDAEEGDLAEAVTAAANVPEVPAGEVPAGTRLVQFGAYDSAETARAEWTKLAERFEDYLVGKTRVVEEASSGGKTFYRLRAMGFGDLAEARRFCAVLMAGKAACIPVVTR